jgi:rhodanese-related sulfurtransferase
MMIKALYSSETGRLLGAQVVGTNGVDRTIDVLATALAAGMTVYDLEHLELAYSPQYSSAKDPVNIVGFVAANDLRGDTDIVHWNEVASLSPQTDVILDVRTDLEASLGTVPGAVNVPVETLRGRLSELDRSKRYVVFCRMGRRGYIAERILGQNGFKAANLTGG